MLIGILLSSAKMDFIIERVSDSKMGYRIKMSLVLRAEKDFLLAVKRTLLQHGVSSNYKEKGVKIRLKADVKDSGVKNLYKLLQKWFHHLLPDAKGEWETLREVIEILNKTYIGLQKDLKDIWIKGCIIMGLTSMNKNRAILLQEKQEQENQQKQKHLLKSSHHLCK